jgi:hypothetical protein
VPTGAPCLYITPTVPSLCPQAHATPMLPHAVCKSRSRQALTKRSLGLPMSERLRHPIPMVASSMAVVAAPSSAHRVPPSRPPLPRPQHSMMWWMHSAHGSRESTLCGPPLPLRSQTLLAARFWQTTRIMDTANPCLGVGDMFFTIVTALLTDFVLKDINLNGFSPIAEEHSGAPAMPTWPVDQTMNVPRGGPSSLTPAERIKTPHLVYVHQSPSLTTPVAILGASHLATDDILRKDLPSPSSSVSSSSPVM